MTPFERHPFDSKPSIWAANFSTTSAFPMIFLTFEDGAPLFGGTKGLSKTHGTCGKKQRSTALQQRHDDFAEWVQKTPPATEHWLAFPTELTSHATYTSRKCHVHHETMAAWTFGMLCQHKARLFWCIDASHLHINTIYICTYNIFDFLYM